jgi:Zn-finger nucleic acid-binding protein
MNCPNCQTTFQEVQVKSRYGANIKINQCPKCGGIWCNSLDMSSISPEEAEKIDKLDIKNWPKVRLSIKNYFARNAMVNFSILKMKIFPKR